MQITIREPASAITHFVGMLMAVLAAMPLLAKAGMSGSVVTVAAMMIFAGSMVLLYGASAVYHAVVVSGGVLKIFQKIDHMMIFVLIAGSYTPVCLIVLGGDAGYHLLAAVWGIAGVGMIIKALWIDCPKWFSSVIYIAMGWVCVFVFRELLSVLSAAAFFWLFAGGVIYTVGGVIYALKRPPVEIGKLVLTNHDVFHLFVMAGSICHFIFMYRFVA